MSAYDKYLPPTSEVLAARGLAKIVREEYPADTSLSEIASTWGSGLTPEEIEAIAAFEEAEQAR